MVHIFEHKTVEIEATNKAQKVPLAGGSVTATFQADENNTGYIYLGGNNLSENNKGFYLKPDATFNDIPVSPLEEISILGTQGDKLHIVLYRDPVVDAIREAMAHAFGLHQENHDH